MKAKLLSKNFIGLTMKKIMLITLGILASLNSFAYDFEVDGIYYNKLSENTVEVTSSGSKNNKYSGDIEIPSFVFYNGITYSVTSIGDGAFPNSKITSIAISDEVSTIGYQAFQSCDDLIEVKMGNGVSKIDNRAFWGCKSLISIIIPDSVSEIGPYAFAGCTGLSSITIGKGLTIIGSEAFRDCNGLTTVNISDLKSWCNISFGSFKSNPLYYSKNFYLNNELLNNITIPTGVISISSNAFAGYKGLISVQIPNDVTSIGGYAFEDCSNLESVAMGDNVSSIGYRAFYNCYSLTSIRIPDAVTSIGGYAFSGCSTLKDIHISNIENWTNIDRGEEPFTRNYNLIINGLKIKELIVPESTKIIGKYTFFRCTSLESITLHKGVTTIVQNAFNGCTNVKKIVCQGDTPPICGAKALEGISRTDCTLYVPETSGSSYKNTTPWSEFENIVGGGTETPDTPKTCEAPRISFDNNTKKLVFASSTEGAEYVYSIASEDMANETKSTGEAAMTGIYTITAYATAEGMYNSEKTTAKLCWVSAEIEGTDIFNAKADRGVLVSSNGGNIEISGTINSETIKIYNAAGSIVKSVKASSNNTTISGLASGNVYIVGIGGRNVKVIL